MDDYATIEAVPADIRVLSSGEGFHLAAADRHLKMRYPVNGKKFFYNHRHHVDFAAGINPRDLLLRDGIMGVIYVGDDNAFIFDGINGMTAAGAGSTERDPPEQSKQWEGGGDMIKLGYRQQNTLHTTSERRVLLKE